MKIPDILKPRKDKKEVEALARIALSDDYQRFLKPLLMKLAQEGYPIPRQYRRKWKLMNDYTFATGGTAKIQEVLTIIDSAQEVEKKEDKPDKPDYAI